MQQEGKNSKLAGVVLMCLAVALAGGGSAGGGRGAQRQDSRAGKGVAAAAPAASLDAYGKLPLVFETNQGQSDPRVKFLARANGRTLFLTSTEAVLLLRRGTTAAGKESRQPDARRAIPGKPEEAEAIIRMRLVGANPAAIPAGLERLPGSLNYILRSDRGKWRTDVPTFAKVRYEKVYPGVDLIYHGDHRQLEYDFIVAPGANPDAIRMSFGGLAGEQGAIVPEVDGQGNLALRTSAGDVGMRLPFVYQQAGEARQRVSCRYARFGKDEVGFRLGAYDRSKPLIIDPVVTYSTYLGGAMLDSPNGIAVDTLGNAYIVGSTSSADFPTTSETLQGTLDGTTDVFITKLSADGKSLIYSTYLGGSGSDSGSGIAVDSDGNAYIAGSTSSTDFPTTPGAFQTDAKETPQGTTFVAKLAPDGKSLVYSTYLGGSVSEIGAAIAVDSAGSAYVAGSTESPDFPTTPGAFQTVAGGNGSFHAFVTKLAPDGKSLDYSTYLAGDVVDRASSIAVDSALSAYVTGNTNSPAFPTTPGVFQPAILDDQSAFVSKLAPDGKSLVYSSFLGGTGSEYDNCDSWTCEPIADYGEGIVVDSAFNAYLTGYTLSSTFPTTANAFQATDTGTGFLTKINAGGTALLYSTYMNDLGDGIALDPTANGSVYLTGAAGSDFPIVNAVQAGCPPGSPPPGCNDAFVAKIDTTQSGANSLVFSSFLGGTVAASGMGIATDGMGNVYVVGYTQGPFAQLPAVANDFPVTPGAFQASPGSYVDGFVVKISPNSAPGFTLDQARLDFSNQLVSTNTPLTLLIGNAGTATLNFSGITLTGTNSADFQETDACGGRIAAGGSCNVTVLFTPSATGTRTASVTFSDDAAGSPQSVALTGYGIAGAQDFTISASPSTAAITAGQSASYTLTLTPHGLGGTPVGLSLSCTGAPRLAFCTVQDSVSLDPYNPSTVTATVSTTAQSFVAPPQSAPWFWPRLGLQNSPLLVLLVLATAALAIKASSRGNQRLAQMGIAFVLLFALLSMSSCAGSSSGGSRETLSGTPSGSYTLTFTGTSASASHSATVTVAVN